MNDSGHIQGKGQGYLKAILVNEHFVVYGVPAIAVPVMFPVEATLEGQGGSGFQLFFRDSAGQRIEKSKDPDTMAAVQAVLKALGVDQTQRSFEITCRSELYGWSGIGSSAAICVAIARAFSQALALNCSDEKINEAAYQGEKIFANNPSGIDNTVATYGNILWYQRGEPQAWAFLEVSTPFWLVIGNSGVSSLTREQVAKVADYRVLHTVRFERICKEAAGLAVDARRCLQQGELAALGALMNQGHSLLQQVGVAHEKLDEMVACCRAHGALGAKLTGAGGGGCMIALAADQDSGQGMVKGLEKIGYEAILVASG